MNRIILFALSFLILSCSAIPSQDTCNNDKAIALVENRLQLVKKKVTLSSTVTSLDFNAVDFFGNLSGHYSSVGDGTWAGILDYSYSDVKKWEKWYNENKSSLCIKENGEVLLIENQNSSFENHSTH